MNFEKELLFLKEKIEIAETIDDLNYLRIVNEKKYWWASILIAGLFYGLNRKIWKMVLAWIINPFTFWIYGVYLIFTSYRDEKEFNERMEFYITIRKKELNKILKNDIELETEGKIRVVDVEYDSLDSQSMEASSSKNILPLKNYEKEIHDLENQYKIKEKTAYELIETHFPPPQLTYDRFKGVIDSCNLIFYNQVESALNIIEVATRRTPKVEGELKKIVGRLKSLVEKIDELSYELTINLNNSGEQSSDEVKDLLEDMQKLVDSVKEYS